MVRIARTGSAVTTPPTNPIFPEVWGGRTVKPGTPNRWRRMWPELRKHRPDAMLKEKERKTRRGLMLAVDMEVRR